MKKRLITIIIICLTLIAVVPISANAVDSSRNFEFKLSVNPDSAKSGEQITVTLTLVRTDLKADATYPIYAMQDEITFDQRLFKLVGQPVLSDEVKDTGFRTAARNDNGVTRIIMSFVSSNPSGDEFPAVLTVGSFRLEALYNTQSGAASINNTNYKMLTPNGKDQYSSSGENAAVQVTGTAGSSSTPGDGSVIGGGNGSGGLIGIKPEDEAEFNLAETPVPGVDTPRFRDVGFDHWALAYVEYMARLGFVKGKTSEEYYCPSDPITRAEFVTILSRMSGEIMPDDYGAEFEDVDSGMYYAAPVKWAADAGITLGSGASAFSPDAPISREQIAAMIVRYAEYKNYAFVQINTPKDFADSGSITSYAKNYVEIMQQANIINGYEDESFRPTGNATRAETAKILALIHYSVSKYR
ncbi:MAG: S-layer homology domain-containing protein [Oscillospiraceae bacterium]|jgi:hypothetical protein|nr:S-layer homology domain-containing protein [Oscillospiraceae bacterium]